MGWGFEAGTVGRCFIALRNLAKFVWSCGLYRDCGLIPPEPNVTSGPKVFQKDGSRFMFRKEGPSWTIVVLRCFACVEAKDCGTLADRACPGASLRGRVVGL